MSDPRIQAIADAFRAAEGDGGPYYAEPVPEVFATRFAAMYDAIRAYDAAHPVAEKQLADHTFVSCGNPEFSYRCKCGRDISEHPARAQADKSAPPLVGADPPPAYRVELASDGCQECRHGTYWCIVGPDGVARGTDYFDKEAAEELAEMLTDAWHDGRADAVAHLTDDAVVEDVWEAIYNFRQDPDYWATLLRAFNDPEFVELVMRAALAAAGKALLGEPG